MTHNCQQASKQLQQTIEENGQLHGRNFVVKCGGTAWCETNIEIGSMQK